MSISNALILSRKLASRMLLNIAALLPLTTTARSLGERLPSGKRENSQKALEVITDSIAPYAQNNGMPWEMVSSLADKLGEWGYLSFSQSGEDAVLRNFLRNKRSGFYVDVGANHPVRFSNTYYYYLRGWRGINIEPMEGAKALFDRYRPLDVNLELAVGQAGKSEFFVFQETCFNTMDGVLAAKLMDGKISELKGRRIITKVPLAEILEKYAEGKAIDFLSVDAEGLDEEILASNDWNRFRPHYIIAERHADDPSRPMDPRGILAASGYALVAQTEFSGVYRDKQFKTNKH